MSILDRRESTFCSCFTDLALVGVFVIVFAVCAFTLIVEINKRKKTAFFIIGKILICHYYHSWNFLHLLATFRAMTLNMIPVVYFLILSPTPWTCREITLTHKIVSINSYYFLAFCTAEVVKLSGEKSIMSSGFGLHFIPAFASIGS